MSHNVETMMYSGALPWHGLGTHVPHNLPWDEAIATAGLAWSVRALPVYAKVGAGYDADAFSAAPSELRAIWFRGKHRPWGIACQDKSACRRFSTGMGPVTAAPFAIDLTDADPLGTGYAEAV